MIAEGEMVVQMDDIVVIKFVMLAQVLQDSDFLLGLSMEAFLVANHF